MDDSTGEQRTTDKSDAVDSTEYAVEDCDFCSGDGLREDR